MRKPETRMTKTEFYKGKTLAETEWWLNVESLPDLVWGRLRVFSDGTADACFAEGVAVYGFENREHAGRLLAQDDLAPFTDLGGEEEEEFGITLSEIEPPTWAESPDQDFVYAGTYPPAAGSWPTPPGRRARGTTRHANSRLRRRAVQD